MSAVIYLNTATGIQELQDIQSLKITHGINDHGYLSLSAKILHSAGTSYILNCKEFETVEVAVGEEDGLKTIFMGIVKEAEIEEIKDAYLLHVDAVTGSYKTDIEFRSRSFQDKDMAYETLMKSIAAEYRDGDLKDTATKGEKLKKFTMQYRETDWAFLKRLASRFHASLVASLINDTPKITVGVPTGTGRGRIEKYSFYIAKDLERYMISKGTGRKDINLLDVTTFYIEIYDNFDIGDKLAYEDIAGGMAYTNLYIRSKEIEMVDGVMRFRYGLCTKDGLSADEIFNEKIVGLSLKGEVLNRVRDTVEVKLEIDDDPPANPWRFPYSTRYTAEGYSGEYVMPEKGDTVFIYFPNRLEEEGFGLNSIRVKNTGTDKIGAPEIKYFRTKDGKEIKMAPGELVITCSNWKDEKTGEENIIYIQLNDKSGITIQSTKPININSDGDINFTADKKLLFAAEDEIKLKCKSSMIKMDSTIEVVSALVKVNGES